MKRPIRVLLLDGDEQKIHCLAYLSNFLLFLTSGFLDVEFLSRHFELSNLILTFYFLFRLRCICNFFTFRLYILGFVSIQESNYLTLLRSTVNEVNIERAKRIKSLLKSHVGCCIMLQCNQKFYARFASTDIRTEYFYFRKKSALPLLATIDFYCKQLNCKYGHNFVEFIDTAKLKLFARFYLKSLLKFPRSCDLTSSSLSAFVANFFHSLR